jgi:hypothetical protein
MDFNGNGPEQQSPVLSKGPNSPGLVRGMSTRAPANEHKAQTKEQLEARLAQLLENITFQVYQFARRGLLDRHKLILATQLVLQVA